MMHFCWLLLAACLFLEASYGQDAPKQLDPAQKLKKDVQMGFSRFALKLNKAMMKEGETKNVIISPFCISTALTFLMLGSSGKTQKEIVETMGFSEYQSDLEKPHSAVASLLKTMKESQIVNITLANALFIHNKFKPFDSFVTKAKDHYDASAVNVNFEAGGSEPQTIVNNWIKEKSYGKIPMLYKEPIDPSTLMLLVNTLYFEAQWKFPFDPQSTSNAVFHAAGNKDVNVQFLENSEIVRYYRSADKPFSSIMLPYKDGVAHMGIILPDQGSSVKSISDVFAESDMEIRKMAQESKEIRVNYRIPKMKLSSSYKLKDYLKALGINDAFDKDLAEFGGITSDKVYVNDVKHAMDLEVTEYGTVASAVTLVEILPGYSLPQQFIADRPFYFYIYHRPTSSVLFSGVVNDPTAVDA